MLKRIVDLPAFSPAVQGQPCTCDIPIGPRYHTIFLLLKAPGKTFTQIVDDIQILVNNKTQRIFSASELDDLNKLNGAIYGVKNSGGAGNQYRLPIFFAEPWRNTNAASEGMAWPTGGLSSFQLQLNLNTTAGSGGAIEVAAVAEVDAPTKDGKPLSMGVISKWYRTYLNVNGLTANITTLPKKGGYQVISLFDANVSAVEVKPDNNTIRVGGGNSKRTKAVNDAILEARSMFPVAGRYDEVFDHDDVIDSVLLMEDGKGNFVQDFQFNLTLSDGTPRAIKTLYQMVGLPD